MKTLRPLRGLWVGLFCLLVNVANGQCPDPVLTVSPANPCAGDVIELHASISLPDGCAIAVANAYVWSATNGGNTPAPTANNMATVTTSVDTENIVEYTVQVNIIAADGEENCPCVGSSMSSNPIQVHPAPNAVPNIVVTSTCPGETAVLEATPTISIQNSEFHWFDTAGEVVYTGNPFTPTLDVTTSYQVVEYFGNCAGPTENVTVPVIPLQAPQPISDIEICEGEQAIITAYSAINGTTEGVFHWFADANANNFLATGNPYTTQSLNNDMSFWVREVNGNCVSDVVQANVIVNPNPNQPNLTADPVCELSNLELTSDVIGVTYDWIGPDGAFFSNIQNPQIANASLTDEGIYTLTVTTPKGCEAENSVFAAIYPNPPVSAGMYDPITEGDILQLQGIGNGNFFWTTNDPTVTFSDPFIPNPIVQPLAAGTYTYTLEVTNEFDCSNTAVTQVIVNESRVLGDPNVGIYNTITPNGDGKNDTWVIPYIENMDNHTIHIFNREGVLVLNHDSIRDDVYQNDWDASYREKPLPEGVYWYYITASVDDDQYEYKGGLFVKR